MGAQCSTFYKQYLVFQNNDKALSKVQGPSESEVLCDQIDLTLRKLTQVGKRDEDKKMKM